MPISSPPTIASILSFLLDWQRKFERLARDHSLAAERSEESADAAARAIQDMRDFLGALTELPRLPPPRKRCGSLEAERLLEVEARAGVSLAIEPARDGSAQVSVNGRPPFRLPPQLAALMTILAAAAERPDPERGGWRTGEEIANALSQHLGHTVKPAHVPRLIYKLRTVMRKAGENVSVVENSRRFAAWRVNARPRRPSALEGAGEDG